MSPANNTELQSYDSWLRVATTHELTHIFHLDRAGSFWGVLQGMFGRVPYLFPIEYQHYPASEVAGEVAADTQPLPTRPKPFARQRLTGEVIEWQIEAVKE